MKLLPTSFHLVTSAESFFQGCPHMSFALTVILFLFYHLSERMMPSTDNKLMVNLSLLI